MPETTPTAPEATAFEPARVGFANGDVKVFHRAQVDDRTGRLTTVDRASYADPNDNQLSEGEHVRHYAAHAWTWIEPEVDSGTLWVQDYPCTRDGSPLNDRTAWFRLAWLVTHEDAVKAAQKYIARHFTTSWSDVAPYVEQNLEPVTHPSPRPIPDGENRFHHLAFRWLTHPETWPESIPS